MCRNVQGGWTCVRNEWGFLGGPLREEGSQEGGSSELSSVFSENAMSGASASGGYCHSRRCLDGVLATQI